MIFSAVSEDCHFKMFSNHGGQFTMIFTQLRLKLLSLSWGLRLDPILGSNAPKLTAIYASIRLAFHPEGALSARKCIAQYRLKFQITHCKNFCLDPPLVIGVKYRKIESISSLHHSLEILCECVQ